MGIIRGLLTQALEQLGRVSSPERVTNEVILASTWNPNRPQQQQVDLYNLIDEGYRRCAVIYVCINELAQSTASPELVVRDKRTQEPVDEYHPLRVLMERPYPGGSRFTLLERGVIDLMSTGNMYLHKGRNGPGMPIQLSNLRPDRVKVIADEKGVVIGYEYRVDTKAQILPAEDVIHVVLPDPLDDFYGLSPIAVCAKFGLIDNEAAGYLADLFLNGAMPAGILKLKTVTRPEERERIKQQWWEQYGRGSTRARPGSILGGGVQGGTGFNKTAVLNGDVEYQQIGGLPNTMGLEAIWGATESRICAVFGVPAVVVQVKIGMEKSTYSNYETAVRSLWTETLPPMYARIATKLTAELASEFSDEPEVVFDLENVPGLQDSEDKKAARAEGLFAAGLVTRNEAREMIGLEPLKGKPAPAPPQLGADGQPVVDAEIVPPGKGAPGGKPKPPAFGKPAPKQLPPGAKPNPFERQAAVTDAPPPQAGDPSAPAEDPPGAPGQAQPGDGQPDENGDVETEDVIILPQGAGPIHRTSRPEPQFPGFIGGIGAALGDGATEDETKPGLPPALAARALALKKAAALQPGPEAQRGPRIEVLERGADGRIKRLLVGETELLGDAPGHPFRGNQYGEAESEGETRARIGRLAKVMEKGPDGQEDQYAQAHDQLRELSRGHRDLKSGSHRSLIAWAKKQAAGH